MNNIQVTHFLDDALQAQTVEEEVLAVIQKKYPKAFKKKGNFKAYDLEVPEIQKTIEVKWDKVSDSTGNYFIETGFNGKPSGIMATKANWWALVDKTHICFIPTDILVYLLRKHFCFNRTITGQDGTKIQYKLIKKSHVRDSKKASFLTRPH